MLKAITVFASVASTLLAASPARALTDEEFRSLRQGAVVTRPRLVDVGNDRYIGGMGYVVVRSSPERLRAMLLETKHYGRFVPRLQKATLVGQNLGDQYVRIEHSLFHASYTVRVHETSSEFQFWVDQGKPHDVEDAWGYMSYEPFREAGSSGPHTSAGCESRLLVRYGIMIRLGPGLVRELFSERLRAAALSLPRRLQRWADEVCPNGVPSGMK